MNFLSKYKLTPAKVLKTALAGIGALIAFTILIKFGSVSMMGGQSFGGFGGGMPGVSSLAPSFGVGAYPEGGGTVSYDAAYSKGLSIQNIFPIPPRTGTTGNTAEDFEVTDYNAHIETRTLKEICAEIKSWKTSSYVIFENASESYRQCYFTFKVEHAYVPEILELVKGLNPKELTEDTNTVKQYVDDFAAQTDILKKKRDSIDKTLTGAIRSYDEITTLATRTKNAEALAKIIDSKIGIIERLSQERINVSLQLDQLAQMKADQLDRLKYAYFNVNVYENKFFDGKDLKDSWKAALKAFLQSVNIVLQSVTVGLLGFFVFLLPILVYALLALLIAKYGWRIGKHIWEK